MEEIIKLWGIPIVVGIIASLLAAGISQLIGRNPKVVLGIAVLFFLTAISITKIFIPLVKTQEEAREEKRGETKSYDRAGVDKETEIPEEGWRLNEFRSLISKVVTTYPDKKNVAVVIESLKTKDGFSPENHLYNLLKTEKVNIVINFFKEDEFKSKGFFREVYDGNTELLTQADVFSKIDYIILGRINYSFRKAGVIDKDLISCDINFSYKVINKNAEVVETDSINVIGSDFYKDRALEQGLEILYKEYFDRVMKSVL